MASPCHEVALRVSSTNRQYFFSLFIDALIQTCADMFDELPR